ncbi:MAG: AAA family ATPase [Bacteroidales bacterium]|nr:AAA family ATPase [Bacteroidales bacterium]
MIKSIRLKNFFSFQDQTIELGASNFMVGINGSGKSNLVKAFRLLKATIIEGEMENLILNKWGGFDAIYFKGKQKESTSHFSIEYEFDYSILGKYGYKFKEPVFYVIDIFQMANTQNYTITESFFTKNGDKEGCQYFSASRGKGMAMEGSGKEQYGVHYEMDSTSDSMLSLLSDSDRYPQIYTLRKAIADISIYGYFDTTETSPMRRPAAPSSATKLTTNGDNLPQLLNWLNLNHKVEYKSIKTSLNAINPNITDINYHMLGTNIELLLEEERLNSSVHVAHVSDGTLRFLCLMAIVHNPKRGSFICIDEPEVGLHPDMICEFMDALEQACTTTQFLITTHSEMILNHTSIDNLLVAEKDAGNSTVIKTFRTDDFKNWAADYTIGSLWRNGDLGGNRY